MLKNYQTTDPEFAAVAERFALHEVPESEEAALEPTDRWLAVLAALVGCQGAELFRLALPEALEAGLAPAAARELVYQAADYLGLGRMLPFLDAANAVFAARGIALPLPAQGTATPETRLQKGMEAQIAIFGERMRTAWQAGAVSRWLAANCFGDYYTRGGLDLRRRELVTFCFLAAQGGCEPQLIAHAKGNFAMGNDAAFLTRAALQCLPYIGYPRTLNALAAVRKAAEQE